MCICFVQNDFVTWCKTARGKAGTKCQIKNQDCELGFKSGLGVKILSRDFESFLFGILSPECLIGIATEFEWQAIHLQADEVYQQVISLIVYQNPAGF